MSKAQTESAAIASTLSQPQLEAGSHETIGTCLASLPGGASLVAVVIQPPCSSVPRSRGPLPAHLNQQGPQPGCAAHHPLSVKTRRV